METTWEFRIVHLMSGPHYLVERKPETNPGAAETMGFGRAEDALAWARERGWTGKAEEVTW